MRKILAFSLCLLLLAGCAGEKTYVPTGDGLTWDEEYTGPTYTQPGEQEEQALNLAYYPEKSLNPLLCTDFTNRALFSLMYQSLFIVDRNYQVEPMLCKNYSVSDDGRTYRFYIEKNVTFSDGRTLTAQDVLASLTHARTSALYSGRFTHVADITLEGDGAIAVYLDTPYENLPILLDVPIIRADQLEENAPLGTGPYMLDQVSHCLRRRENWWCSADMEITAQTISLMEAESATQIRDQFEFFDLSLVYADPGSDRYADFRCDYELWDCDNGIFLYLACSEGSSFFSDPEVRAALTYAVDRSLLAEDYYRGFARPATLPASPLSPWYSQALAQQYAYAPEKFKEAIKDKALPETEEGEQTPIILLVNSDDSLRLRVARRIGEMLEECGLTVEISARSGEDYKNALRRWEYDLYLGQTMLSPNMDLSAFFDPYGDLSWGGVNDVTAYNLNLQALENHGNYYTLHKTVMDNGLICPILFRSYAVYAVRGLLTGLTPARDNVFYYSLGKTMEAALMLQN